MDFPWGSEFHQKFITNVGLITSEGPNGPNVMAAEWTYLVSYSPAHILISVGPRKATMENIRATKEFGVSIASTTQNWVASIAGGSTGRSFDKISALEELGVKFTPGKKLNVKLVEGSALQAECKVLDIIDQGGDHLLILGEVVHATLTSNPSLAYHQNAYWKMDSRIEKTSEDARAARNVIVQKHAKR